MQSVVSMLPTDLKEAMAPGGVKSAAWLGDHVHTVSKPPHILDRLSRKTPHGSDGVPYHIGDRWLLATV